MLPILVQIRMEFHQSSMTGLIRVELRRTHHDDNNWLTHYRDFDLQTMIGFVTLINMSDLFVVSGTLELPCIIRIKSYKACGNLFAQYSKS